MTPAARLRAVIDISAMIDKAPVPMDGVIGDAMRGRRYIGAKDRAAISARLYALMRARARIDWHLARIKAEPGPRMRALAGLALLDGMAEEEIAALCDGGKHAPKPLSEAERAVLEQLAGSALEPAEMPEPVLAECPEDCLAALKALWGGDFLPEMRAMQKEATLDLRVNIHLASREDVLGLLAQEEISAHETPCSPWGIRLESRVFLSGTAAYRRGLVEIQDEGSQLVALACGAAPGMQVLDFCAGGGGKTLALGAAMGGKGRIVAADIDPKRLSRSKPRLKRARISDMVEIRPLDDDRHRRWLRRQKETFDVVLTDVPCTGTGTWRRNPDLRWHRHGPPLEELLPIQAEILERASKAVKPGGRLVYATCSLLPRENEDQIEAFLSANPGFHPVPPPAPCEAQKYLRLTPLRHGTDGFFTAVLERRQE